MQSHQRPLPPALGAAQLQWMLPLPGKRECWLDPLLLQRPVTHPMKQKSAAAFPAQASCPPQQRQRDGVRLLVLTRPQGMPLLHWNWGAAPGGSKAPSWCSDQAARASRRPAQLTAAPMALTAQMAWEAAANSLMARMTLKALMAVEALMALMAFEALMALMPQMAPSARQPRTPESPLLPLCSAVAAAAAGSRCWHLPRCWSASGTAATRAEPPRPPPGMATRS